MGYALACLANTWCPGGRSPAAAPSSPRFRGLFTLVLSTVDQPTTTPPTRRAKAPAAQSTTHGVLHGAASSSESLALQQLYCPTPQRCSNSFPASAAPPPIPARTGVLSPSRSASEANLARRWRPECDKSICPGLNLYANLE